MTTKSGSSSLCNNNNNGPPVTDLLYMTYEGNFWTECESRIVQVVVVPPLTETPAITNATTMSAKDTNQVCLVLDRTVMHAQGGGQPTDIGQLRVRQQQQQHRMLLPSSSIRRDSDHHHHHSTPEDPMIDATNVPNERDLHDANTSTTATTTTTTVIIDITKVELDRTTGIVKHYGTTTTTIPLPLTESNPDQTSFVPRIGDLVHVQVHREQRRLLSECHTAGHVVDAAMIQCGFYLKPSKGYHFLDSPYVEYHLHSSPGDNNNNDDNNSCTIHEKQDLSRLQLAFQQLLEQDIPTKIELLSKEQAQIRCQSQIPTVTNEMWWDMDQYTTSRSSSTSINDATVRIVTVAGYACPCGGTHVRSTGDLQQRRRSSSGQNDDNDKNDDTYTTWNITGIKCKPKGYVRIKYGRITSRKQSDCTKFY